MIASWKRVLLFGLIFMAMICSCRGFLIGGCIGPKKVFERYLNEAQRKELTRLVENTFDGRNRDQVLLKIYIFLQARLSPLQWYDIVPEILAYQKLNIACSPYSQLLPPKYFRPLLKSVRRAVENGADRKKLKYLIEDYLDRVLFTKEFIKEYRKQPPYIDVLPPDVLRPQLIVPPTKMMKITPSTTPPKPLFPIVEFWKVLPSAPNNFYFKKGSHIPDV